MASKLAFLFLTRGDVNQPAVWTRFFEEADASKYSVYVHAKEAEEIRTPFLAQADQLEPIPTARGDISLVRATILLIQAALEDPENEYFILASESCIPIRTFGEVYDEITKSGASWFGIHKDDEITTMRYRRLKERDFVPRERFYKHDQWFVLTREAAEAVVKNDYTEVFANVFAADEHYFTTVLAKEGYPVEEKMLRRAPTFVNWDEKEAVYARMDDPDKQFYRGVVTTFRPKNYDVLTESDVEAARAKGCLFFRKVSASCDCGVVLEKIKV